jgi:hemerythrin-like domain-containing protein
MIKTASGKRWVPWAAAGVAALAAGKLVATRVRASRGRGDPLQDYVARFRLSHEALRRNLDRFVAIAGREDELDADAFGAYVGLFGRFLIVHHESEDEVIFPTLRRYGRLKSTDAAHLDGWTAEHRAVNAAGEALARAGERARTGGRLALTEVGRLSRELADLLRPHLASEEELFTPVRLAEIIPPQAVGEIERSSRRRFSADREIPLFFAHSLYPDEQRRVFGAAPWIFRRAVFPLMDKRSFPRFAPFVVSPLQV